MTFSPVLVAYQAAMTLLGPFADLWLNARARQGKEDRSRMSERYGRYTQARPDGALIWLHAASVGESGVALNLIDALAAREPALSFLLSTGTRTSADMIAARAPARVTHVYTPLDRGDVARRFLAHWRPDAGVFVESDLWPNLILKTRAAGVPLALVNARMSPATLARWRRWRAAGGTVLKAFNIVAAADARTAEALSDLRAAPAPLWGNLKLAAPAPRVDPAAREALAREVGGRPVWLAASTHAGEDEIALAAHAIVRAKLANALLIIAPRHPERGEAVAALAQNAPRRSGFQPIGDAPVYVADTLGELGLFYDLAPAALVAGSLLPQLKGHNPIEPAKLDCAIVSGPNVESFDDLFATLFDAGGAVKVNDTASLAQAIGDLLTDDDARARQTQAARTTLATGADALALTADAVLRLLPQRVATTQAANASA